MSQKLTATRSRPIEPDRPRYLTCAVVEGLCEFAVPVATWIVESSASISLGHAINLDQRLTGFVYFV